MIDSSPPSFVYKIFRLEEWQSFQKDGTFGGSPDDARDGFIHLSTQEQLAGTLAKHFTDCPGVVIAKIQTAGLPIQMEVSRGQMLFPHLYGTLRREAVVSFEKRDLP